MRDPRSRLLALSDLDRFRCDVPGCTACVADGRIYLRARCHPGGALFVSYGREADDRGGGPSPAAVGTIVVECARCDREVARIVVGT